MSRYFHNSNSGLLTGNRNFIERFVNIQHFTNQYPNASEINEAPIKSCIEAGDHSKKTSIEKRSKSGKDHRNT